MLHSTATTASERTLMFSVDAEAIAKLIAALGAGGVLGQFVNRWQIARRKKQAESVQFTATILEDGGELRKALLAENKELRVEKDAAIERAHKAELELARSSGLTEKLQRRLTERDAQLKALQTQVAGLGHPPVVTVASHGPGGAQE